MTTSLPQSLLSPAANIHLSCVFFNFFFFTFYWICFNRIKSPAAGSIIHRRNKAFWKARNRSIFLYVFFPPSFFFNYGDCFSKKYFFFFLTISTRSIIFFVNFNFKSKASKFSYSLFFNCQGFSWKLNFNCERHSLETLMVIIIVGNILIFSMIMDIL